MKKIYRKQYDFGDPEKYRMFLKRQLLKLNPRYYSVASFKKIETSDGPMYAVRIVLEIENPGMEPIAECWINDQYIYLWRDYCWTIAVNDKGNEVLNEDYSNHPEEPFSFAVKVPGQSKLDIAPKPCNKTMVVHRIGGSI